MLCISSIQVASSGSKDGDRSSVDSSDGNIVNGPPYILNASYIGSPAIVVDGNLNEPAWSDPNTALRLTTDTFEGWNLSIRIFHNLSYLFVGVELIPDTSLNPNDFCELAFDVNNNNLAPPEASDLKIQGAGTTIGVNLYSLYNGSGAGWSLYSDQTGLPNPWPADYATIGEMRAISTYEFQLPVSAAWGTPAPANGSTVGFTVHGFGQADNEHVWWPDQYEKKNNPTIEYCDNAANYGDLVFISPPVLTPDHLEYVSGDDQAGIVDTNCAAPIVFNVHNATNVSVPGAQVNFTITSTPSGANNSYFTESGNPWYVATSDASGNASATLHLGTKVGDYWVNVSGAFPGLAGLTYNDTINATAYAGPADHVVYISGDGASAEVGQTPPPFWARVVDQYDNNVSNVNLWWNITSTPAGASGHWLSNNSSGSDASGLVSSTLTLGDKNGWYNTTCENLTLPGAQKSVLYNSTAMTGSTLHAEYIAGDGQSGTVGTQVGSLWARVVDQFDNNVSGANVSWDVTATPGGASIYSLSNATSTSAGDGLVSTNLTLGDRPGTYTVRFWNASFTGSPNSTWYNETALVGPAYNLTYVSGDGQSGPINTALLPFWARVTDFYGNNVSGSIVWWNITSNPGGAVGMVLSNLTSTSDADGLVSTTLTLGDLTGWYNVTCENNTLAGNNAIWFNSTATSVPFPNQLEYISGSPQSGVVGASLAPVWAKVVDQFGNGIAGVDVYWNITDNPAGASGQFLYNNSSVSDASGFVSTRLLFGNLPGWYNFTCVNLSLPGAQKSVQYNSTAAFGAPATIAIGTNLTVVPVQQTAALTVWLNDAFGNGCPGYVVSLSFDTNPSAPNAVLGAVTDNGDGTYSAIYTSGRMAWVTDIIRATQGVLSSTVNIDVTAGEPFSIAYLSGNGQTRNAGEALGQPFLVVVKDGYGNPVSGVQIDWAVDGFPGGATGHVMSPASNLTNASGVAGSLLTLGNNPGLYYINATNATLSLAGEPIGFAAQALSVLLNLIMISGDGQTGTANATLPAPLVVEVRDQGGATRSGVSVWFNVTYGGGTVAGTTPAVTNAIGRAMANLTLGASPGANTVSAEIGSAGVNRVLFNATGTLPRMTATLAANQMVVAAGSTFVYVIYFNNNGTEAAKNVWINDTLPDDAQYVWDSSGAIHSVSGNSHSWFFLSLPIGSHSFIVTVRANPGAADGTRMSNFFAIACSDQADGAMPSVGSNTVLVTISATAGSNVPPTIDGVPDLIVHHDWDYKIDLSPYITDPDTNFTDLTLILSDSLSARVDARNNLLMVLNYSISYLGMTLSLNITVSDGLGSDWQVIKVKVVNNFPPEILKGMPDVTLDEDTIAFPFNITEYFFDREGDSLYFASGNRSTIVGILDNGTVRVTALRDWFGMERVRFRAAQVDSNALVETIINITVRPVNDPPFITPIEDQSGIAGTPWPLDLSPYIGDVDNNLSDLVVTTDSGHVTVNGHLLTLRFPSATPLDIVTITVSDGKLQSYMQFNVTVLGAPSELLPPWLIPIIIAAMVALIAFIIYKRRKPLIEQTFLIYKDGALIAHATSKVIPDMDSEIFTSMLTAIQDFVKDSFKDEKKWDLKKLEFGDQKIMIEHSGTKNISIALVYRGKGDERRLLNTAKDILTKVELAFGDLLADWDGNLDKLRGTRDIIAEELGKG
ncbi:MAG: DUF11 domain-containing protein [Euryarchaeota archaeon]|nr:DUF11 domain-containing protein [Euryarchaeota archaeon]